MAKQKLYKKCPRCGEKTFVTDKVCDNCKLVFARMENASNKEAKRAIKAGKKNYVLKTNQLPKDLSKWKLFFICLGGGLVGAHNIYIGRYLKGFFSLFFVLLTAILVMVLPGNVLSNVYNMYLFLPGAFVMYFWFYDMLMIGINKYKVPVALEIPKTKRAIDAGIAIDGDKDEQE